MSASRSRAVSRARARRCQRETARDRARPRCAHGALTVRSRGAHGPLTVDPETFCIIYICVWEMIFGTVPSSKLGPCMDRERNVHGTYTERARYVHGTCPIRTSHGPATYRTLPPRSVHVDCTCRARSPDRALIVQPTFRARCAHVAHRARIVLSRGRSVGGPCSCVLSRGRTVDGPRAHRALACSPVHVHDAASARARASTREHGALTVRSQCSHSPLTVRSRSAHSPLTVRSR